VIPNGFTEDLFYPQDRDECRKKLGLPLDRKIILPVGNLVKVKGHKYLIEAMEHHQFRKHYTDIFCVIVGSGSLQGALEKQIHAAGLEECVFLAGDRPHEEIPVWMNACDVFVLPSLNEGNSTMMFECLGCGKPFVGTDVGGVGEIIEPEHNGLLCQPRDPERLASTIASALEREWDISEIAHLSSQYSWENIVKEILEIYREMDGL